MKKIVLISCIALLFVACGQSKKQNAKVVEQEKAAVVLTIDQVLEQAMELADKEVLITGTVMHVCKSGGERCFLMGSNEDITIRVEAGEKIGAFTQEQMGSDLQIVGILKEVKSEADAHNPAKEHGEGEHAEGEHGEHDHAHDADADAAHEVIAANQEAAERIFFIEGLKLKESKE